MIFITFGKLVISLILGLFSSGFCIKLYQEGVTLLNYSEFQRLLGAVHVSVTHLTVLE